MLAHNHKSQLKVEKFVSMKMANHERNRYTDLGADVLKALADDQLEDGTIYDEVDGSNTPDNHYAHTFFALAACLASRYQEGWKGKGEKALEYFANIPNKKKGHHEFNLLACLLIQETLKERWLASSERLACSDYLLDYVKKAPFEAGEQTPHGNNWIAIQALDSLLRYHQLGNSSDLQRANHLINHYVLKWQLSDGIFYDAPQSPDAKHVRTPLTYHAKFCMILLLYAYFSDRIDVYRAALRGLDALSKLISPNGEGFYFGRTNNAIFGYASALYAYEAAIQHIVNSKEKDEATTNRIEVYRRTADALFSYLKAMQNSDGSLRLTPGSIGLYKAGWDSYMHHTVYNAYASAVLLMTPYTPALREANLSDRETSIHYLGDSGFLAVKHGHNFLVLNTKGQGTDPRYTGMTPLIWYVEEEDLLPSSLTRKEDFKTGFIPVIKVDARQYVPTAWHNARLVNNEAWVTIFSEGVLNRVFQFPSNKMKNLLQCLKTSTALRNFARKSAMIQTLKVWNRWFQAHSIPLELYRGVIISRNCDSMFIIDTVKTTKKVGKLKIAPPSLLLSAKRASNLSICGNKLILQLKNAHLSSKFEILWPKIEQLDQLSQLDTSKGPATLLTPSEVFLSTFEGSFHSVALLQVYKEGRELDYQVKTEENEILIYKDSTLLLSINTVNRTVEFNDNGEVSEDAAW